MSVQTVAEKAVLDSALVLPAVAWPA